MRTEWVLKRACSKIDVVHTSIYSTHWNIEDRMANEDGISKFFSRNKFLCWWMHLILNHSTDYTRTEHSWKTNHLKVQFISWWIFVVRQLGKSQEIGINIRKTLVKNSIYFSTDCTTSSSNIEDGIDKEQRWKLIEMIIEITLWRNLVANKY